MDHAVAHRIGDLLGGVDELADLALLPDIRPLSSVSICSPAVVKFRRTVVRRRCGRCR
jgi:hypothetical protein